VHISGMASALERLGYSIVFSSPMMLDPRATAGANPFDPRMRSRWQELLTRFTPGALFELMEIAYNFVAFRRNQRLVSVGGFQFIYERHAFFLFSTALLATRHSLPLIIEVNELVGDERVRAQPLLAPVARWCDRVAFERAALIVVVSPHLKRRIEAMGISSEKVLVLPNAISAEAHSQPASGQRVRERLELSGNCTIAFVGWFVPWHHLDWLVEAFADLAAMHPTLRLLLIGDGPLRQNLVSQVQALDVQEKVCFAGNIKHADVAEYVAAADICVIPHSNEYRSPIKLFEYMAEGRAIVAPATEPISCVIGDGMNGVLFKPGLKEDLKVKLASLVADPQLREKLGECARTHVLATHTWENNAQMLLRKLQALTAV
jgi:glycosyltransferase involved in cell wall biosynthesis